MSDKINDLPHIDRLKKNSFIVQTV